MYEDEVEWCTEHSSVETLQGLFKSNGSLSRQLPEEPNGRVHANLHTYLTSPPVHLTYTVTIQSSWVGVLHPRTLSLGPKLSICLCLYLACA